jgi:predicted dehydrogenase
MNLRFHPAIRRLRDLVSCGALGAIRYAQVSAGSDLRTWRPGTDYRSGYSARAALGGGIVRDSIHELDYITWILGPAASITAEVARVSDLEIDVEDVGLGLVRLASGALVSVDLTYIDTVYRRSCMLVGAAATARWEWTTGTIEIAAPGADPRVLDVAADVSATYVATIHDFLEAVVHGRQPCADVDQGCAMVELAAALLDAAHTGQRVHLKRS